MAQALITCDPDFNELALAELRPLGIRPQMEIAPGVWLVNLKSPFLDLGQQWQEQPPIFIRHLCPVYATLSLAAADNMVDRLRQAVEGEFLELIEPTLPFSVQTRIFGEPPLKPFDVNTAVANMIQAQTAAPLDPRRPQQILSIVVASQVETPKSQIPNPKIQSPHADENQNPKSKIQNLQAYLGLSLAAHNLSDWAGGVRRFAREEGQISRAEFKLLEALEVFKIELPAGGVALDLGASPGGWTRVLRQREQFVTAVDPAALHPSLATDRKVRQQRMTAEAYLATGPDPFDFIGNDMRQDARDSARLMVAYAPYLRPHGTAVMTLKLPERGRPAIIEYTFAILRRAYHLAGARQLFHNRSEITVLLRKHR